MALARRPAEHLAFLHKVEIWVIADSLYWIEHTRRSLSLCTVSHLLTHTNEDTLSEQSHYRRLSKGGMVFLSLGSFCYSWYKLMRSVNSKRTDANLITHVADGSLSVCASSTTEPALILWTHIAMHLAWLHYCQTVLINTGGLLLD